MSIEGHKLRRRAFLSATAVPFLVPAGGLVSATPAVAAGRMSGANAATEPELLSVPLYDVNVIGAQILTRADGVPVLCGVTTGQPAKICVVDARSGELLLSEPLPGAGGSYGVSMGPDGWLYIATYSSGHLYRADPASGEVQDLGQPVPGETFLWDLAIGADGDVFGVSYPGAKLYRYDPATGETRDYGSLVSDTKYARALAIAGGAIYVGTSRGVHFLKVDPSSGETQELPLPAGVIAGDTGMSVWSVAAAGDQLYVRIGSDIKYSPLYVFDLATQTWGPTLDNVAGLQLPPLGSGGRAYVMHNNELTAWNPASGETTGTGLVYPGRVWNYRGVGWVGLDDPDWPGQTLTGWFWRGEMWRYNPQTGRHSITTQATVPGEPVEIISLTTSRAGEVLAGGYLAGFASVNPDDGTSTFHRFSQTETLLDDGEHVWVGAYPDSRGYRYDPDLPWSSPEYSPGPPGTPDNPVKVWDLKENADPQDRVFALARVGDLLVAGTGPESPTFGGTVVVHNVQTEDSSVVELGLGDRAVCDLAVRDGVVYGGTWIYGGSGAPDPTLSEGNLFAFDPVTGDVLWTSTPVPGAASYAGVLVDRDGRLWTIADTTLAEIDPENGEAIRVIPLGDEPGGGRTFPNTVAIMAEASDAPLIYVKSADRMWRVWTDTGAVEDLGLTGYRVFTLLPDGSMALSRREQLYRWQSPEYDTSPPSISVALEDHEDETLPRIAVTVEDVGSSGVGRVRYRLDRGEWRDYAEPVEVGRPGRHLIEVAAVDGARNQARHAEAIVVMPPSSS